MRKTVRMLNFCTIALDQILLMGKSPKSHEGLGYTREKSQTKCSIPKAAAPKRSAPKPKIEKKEQYSRTRELKCYYCRRLGHKRSQCSYYLVDQQKRQHELKATTKQI